MHLSSASLGEGRGSQADVGLALGRFFLLANYSLFGKTKHLKGGTVGQKLSYLIRRRNIFMHIWISSKAGIFQYT